MHSGLKKPEINSLSDLELTYSTGPLVFTETLVYDAFSWRNPQEGSPDCIKKMCYETMIINMKEEVEMYILTRMQSDVKLEGKQQKAG